MRKFAIAATVLALCGPAITSDAQQTGSDRVIVDVDNCVDLGTREQRLECYEERVNETLRAREAEGSAVATDTTNVGTTTVEPEPSGASRRDEQREVRAADGRRETPTAAPAAAEAAGPAAQAAAAEGQDDTGEIVARISALREVEPNAYVITLDNGQVWRQDFEKPYRLRVGAEVRLRPSNWGSSYRLTDPNVGNFIPVRRVR